MLQSENDIRMAESDVVLKCKNQFGSLGSAYTKYQVVTAANSSMLAIGEELIIAGGAGEFNKSSTPDFPFGGIKILPDKNGVAEYKITVGNKPGKYKIPIRIRFLNKDGKPDSLNKEFEYTIIKEAVSKAAQC